MQIKDDGYLLTIGLGFFLFMIIAMSMGCREKQGAPGPSGPSGIGVQGIQGESGTIGASGKNGQSIVGPQGEVGPSGTSGSSAKPCTVAETSGGASVTCNGNSVNINNGLNGESGPSGSVGATGPAGPSGATGASVTAVRLCADSTSAFPEYGVQIGGALYAVYFGVLNGEAQPQAFLAQLTQGNYESTNGSGCLFTVNADGSVTN
jgi:hypothetical protein